MLRMTGARLVHFAGISLVEIMEALEHTSESMKIRYLGLTTHELAKTQVCAFECLDEVDRRTQDKDATPQPKGAETERLVISVRAGI